MQTKRQFIWIVWYVAQTSLCTFQFTRIYHIFKVHGLENIRWVMLTIWGFGFCLKNRQMFSIDFLKNLKGNRKFSREFNKMTSCQDNWISIRYFKFQSNYNHWLFYLPLIIGLACVNWNLMEKCIFWKMFVVVEKRSMDRWFKAT